METHGELSTSFALLQGITQAIQGDTATLKRTLEESHDEAASGTKLIRSDVSQMTSNVIKAVRRGEKRNAKRQRRLGQVQVNSSRQMLKNMEQLQATIVTYLGRASPAGPVHSDRFTQSTDNMESTVMPLMLMKSSLREVLGKLGPGGEMYLSSEELQLLQSEVIESLAAAYEASAAALKRSQPMGEDGSPTAHYQTTDVDSQLSPRFFGLGAGSLPTKRQQRKAVWQTLIHRTFAGLLFIRILRDSGRSSPASSASITFVPRPELYRVGLSIVLTKEVIAAMNPGISRCIRTFRVIPFHGSDVHPAVRAIRRDDVGELQRLLSAKDISPWDRSKEGIDLLKVRTSIWYILNKPKYCQLATMYGSREIANLLIREGSFADDVGLYVTLYAYLDERTKIKITQ